MSGDFLFLNKILKDSAVLKVFKPAVSKDDVAKLVKHLSDADVSCRVNKVPLVTLIASPDELLKYIQNYSVIKEPELIKIGRAHV